VSEVTSLRGTSPIDLPWRDERTGDVLVIVETPRGSRNKYAFDPIYGQFRLKKVLPLGFSFPFDFGFIPSTRGADGDPLDVLVLLDEPLPMGCLVKGRPIGVIELEQTRDGRTFRNDRLIVLPTGPSCRNNMQCLEDLPNELLSEIEAFFMDYARQDGRYTRPLGRGSEARALELIREGVQQASTARTR